MAQDFGNGVSRTLSAAGRQYQVVVWQASKPPLDSELNLIAQVDWERAAETIRAQAHSGFLLDPMVATTDFVTNPNWSNFFRLGNANTEPDPVLWANVNGWMVPVTGTAFSGVSNQINLFPAPESSTRVDMVFLEVWMAQVAPNPSTTNKPASDAIWKYGNVKYGGTNEVDEMEDPTIGFETTERLQLQYRIRVVGQGPAGGISVDLATFPDGLDDPNMLAQGASDAPLPGVTWSNMRETLGDPGLWRAGNGDPTNSLGTVDGYSYAIPICAVFRRNSSAYVNLTTAGSPNQNGALQRNPISATITDPAAATRTFSDVTLVSDLARDTGAGAVAAIVQVAGLDGSGLDNANINWESTYLMLGDEIIGIDSVDTSVVPNTITISAGGRGRYGTQAKYHAAGTPFKFYCYRPDGLYADQVAPGDILDLRRSITLGEWDYEQLLAHNLQKLFKGELRSSYKQSGISDVEGSRIIEVDSLFAGTSVPNQTEHVDGPDGIRTVFSDASTTQNDVTLLLDYPSSAGEITTFVAGEAWDVGAGFVPAGYATDTGWNNDTVIDLFIGGASGSDGARASMRGAKNVRFATPWENWLAHQDAHGHKGNQSPVTMTFIGGEDSGPPGNPDNVGLWADPAPVGFAARPGPMYPLETQRFLHPFCMLGGIVNDNLHSTSVSVVSSTTTGGRPEVHFSGVNFETLGSWYSENENGDFANDPTAITNPLVHGTKTLYQMLTNDGTDPSGMNSQLFIIIRGDTVNTTNNGLWQVIGAGGVLSTGFGPAGNGMFTTNRASVPNGMAVRRVSAGGTADFVDSSNIEGGVRSMFTHTEDGLSSTSPAAACVVITDIDAQLGGASNPWNGIATGAPLESKMLLTVGLEYGPGRGAMARQPQSINRFGLVGSGANMLRQAPGALDNTFPGVPLDQIYYPPQQLQTWNRLSSRGLHAPKAPAYGGERVVFSEMERESELFVDPGSKTVLFRPFQNQNMTLVMRENNFSLLPVTYPAPAGYNVDGASVLVTGTVDYSRGYALPQAYMPRFGRQDIPYHTDLSGTGAGTFLEGFSHLFNDSATDTAAVFNLMGGNDNAGVAGVRFMFAQTIAEATTGLGWGEWGNVPGGTPYGDDNGYQARLLPEDVNVISSDVPRGLRGIQLPPFLGIGRLIAVYDARNWDGVGAYGTNRITKLTGASVPVNLLRTDADKQTLYIVEGGGASLTDPTGTGVGADDHTYVIPENAIDITRSPNWTSTEEFSDLEYIVCFEAFGFARGFINKNNYVIPRLHNGDGDAPAVTATPVSMILPSAAPYSGSSQAFVTYTRPVYQGDPYMTRGGDTRTVSDYEPLYGTIPSSDSWYLNAPIQQFEVTQDYAQVPEKKNPRALEVLAYADFYTTLGSGKMGGEVYPGTITDVGHLTSNPDQIPSATTSPDPQPLPRTFTQGPTQASPRAVLEVHITDFAALADTTTPSTLAGTSVIVSNGPVSITAVAEGVASGGADRFVVGTSNNASALSLYLWFRDNPAATAQLGVNVTYDGGEVVRFESRYPGKVGNNLEIILVPGSSSASTTTISGIFVKTPAWAGLLPTVPGTATPTLQTLWTVPTNFRLAQSRSHFAGGADLPVNASAHHAAATSIQLTGLTERLPLGMLARDYHFTGEDFLRDGSSMLRATQGVADTSSHITPQTMGQPYSEVSGPGSFMGMSDGGINDWVAYDRVTQPLGSKVFRIHRGAAVYSLDPLNLGGPVHWSSSMPEGSAVIKGAVLVGRAYLVRNYKEQAFTSNDVTSWGDEVQMVITTSAVFGEGPSCYDYVLDGQISPTGYGKGYASSDRYRLEGKPLVSGHSKVGPNPDVFLAPYPNVDPDDDPCP